jgi:hypothetical protein
MNLDRVTSGRDLANDFNVIVEIPMNANPIKYEVDKATGALFVDRFVSTAMHYPCNYGYIPDTLPTMATRWTCWSSRPFRLLRASWCAAAPSASST